MAHLGAAARDAAREETSRERRLQAELFGDNHEAVKHAPLQPGEYQLEVWVGAPMKDAMQAPIAFPSESLPFSPTGFELTVVVTSHNTGIPNASRQLLLPVVGASERLNFSMHISRDQRRSDVRIAILHEGRLLQTVLLSATVGSGERRDLSLSLEGVIRRDLDGVSGRRPFDASLLFNDLGDEPSVTAYAGQNVSLCDSKRIDAVLATITQILEDATNRPKLHGTPDKKKSTELLASLARQGHLLREALLEMPNVQASLSQASRIQVVTKRPEEPIPLEICYDAPPPANGAGMCKEWKRALAGGACQTRCPPNKSEVVCPVAFWGTKIVIERHQYSKEAAREVGSNDFAIHQREPTGGKRISLVGTSVCGAAKVARSADPAAVDSAFHAAAAAVGSMAGVANEVKTWADWQVAVSGGTARLLVLLAHTDVRGTDRALVIHEDELALLTEIGAGYVVGTGNAPPVVLLLGCSTALPDGLAQFTTRFRRAGAAVVVGTLCRVLGRHSAPIARVLIEKLALASRKPDPTPFGELLRDIRREMLAEGYPIVFAITAFGDADWVV